MVLRLVLTVAAALVLSARPALIVAQEIGFKQEPGGPLAVLAFGDSLTAGYGLRMSRSYPALLEKRLRADGFNVRVVNGGVSGETSSGGVARLAWVLADPPDIAVVELGANDGLRGLPVDAMRANLDAIITEFKAAGTDILFTGMKAPPGWGPDYARDFADVFPELAAKHQVAFVPFFLQDVAGNPALNQGDGIHPNEQGVQIILDNLYPHIKPLLQNRRSRAGVVD